MVAIGNFFFKYRNWLFILFYAVLFVPSPPIFPRNNPGSNYFLWPVWLGLIITISGQLIRGLTIGLAYIVRGGKAGKPYAEGLVTEGIFNHCRNPLYVGNILMLLGIGVLANSLIYVAVMMPLFIFIYQAIVLAEESFLYAKFGEGYLQYCKKVNRWFPRTRGLRQTFSRMKFNWKRWILKEHTTQLIWLSGIILIVFMYYPELTGYNERKRNLIMIISLSVVLVLYLLVRYLKKSGKWKAD